MQGLQFLIEQITKGRNLHISILDLSGILDTLLTEIEFKNVIHSKRFCDIAKSTAKGYRVCMRCKMLANNKAVREKKPFFGCCMYGLYEVGYPVVRGGNVAAIIYVGNAVADKAETAARIEKTCSHTGADKDKLCEEMKKCELICDETELFRIAELVSDYMVTVYDSSYHRERKMHWLVSLIKSHADEMQDISLGELALTFQKNEKYLGRLFKKEMGMSFTEYRTGLRLHKAEKLLAQTDDKIIDIAFECGFENISYFNRVFKKKYGMSPKTYRQSVEKPIFLIRHSVRLSKKSADLVNSFSSAYAGTVENEFAESEEIH